MFEFRVLLPVELRQQLDVAAKHALRSMTKEVEFRLRESLERERRDEHARA
jgi:Arc-like DNA binding domain